MRINVGLDTSDVLRYFQKFPSMMADATEIGLDDIGQTAIGHAKQAAPNKTGNLRRSIAYSGRDNFPDLTAGRGVKIPERGERELSRIRNEVWIGTNLNYAGIQEERRGYMQSAVRKITGGYGNQAFEKALKIVLRSNA